MAEFATVAILMAGLGISLSTLLALANWKLYVFEDPRIDEVEEMLPGANCGACGKAGCRAFAEAIVEGSIAPGKCTVNAPDETEAIATMLGVEAGAEEKKVAMLACAGGSHVSWTRARYQGLKTCRAAALVAGGGKGCAWGCLGLADCQLACTFDAIVMDPHGLPVVDEDKCTACGDCVEACPKDLFSLHPISHRLWVACKSLAEGDQAEAECEVACTGCGLCAADGAGVVEIRQNLAIVDYSKNHLASPKAIQRCPTGAIVWRESDGSWVKGVAAKKITRRSALPILPAEPRASL